MTDEMPDGNDSENHTSEGLSKSVEQLLDYQKQLLEEPWLYLVCYGDRPLQGIPPDGNGPHLLLFTSKEGADQFCRDRENLFGKEPLSVCPIGEIKILLDILHAISKDPKYTAPPCGMIVDFSIQEKSSFYNRSPQEIGDDNIKSFSRVLSDQGILHGGKKETVQAPESEPSVPSADHEGEEFILETVKEEEDVRTGKQDVTQVKKGRSLWVYVASGFAVLLIIGTILVSTETIDMDKLISRLKGSLAIDTSVAIVTDSATPYKTATPSLPTETPVPVLLEDDFSDPSSGWTVLDQEGIGYIGYRAGQYQISIEDSDRFLSGVHEDIFSNVDVKVRIHPISASSNSDVIYGVRCRVQSDMSAYQFDVWGDGFYSITRSLEDEFEFLIEPTFSSRINQGLAENKLRVICAGDRLALYVNDYLLAEAYDTSMRSGKLGLYGGFLEDGTAMFSFDDLLVLKPVVEEKSFIACEITDTGGINDIGYNQMTFDGIQEAMNEFDIAGRYYESNSASDYEENMQTALNAGCDVIISVGFLLSDTTNDFANRYKDRNFSIVDMSYDPPLPNVLGQVYEVEDAAFLAGYLAAGMSNTGVVATYGGIQIPPITTYMDGFTLGAQHYANVKGKTIRVLGWDPQQQTGEFVQNFERVEDGRVIARQFISQGADVIFPVAGPVGIGTAEIALEEKDVLVIGMDTDWRFSVPEFGDVILTSVIKNMDRTTYLAIEQLINGEFEGGILRGTLENGGVGLAPYGELDGSVPQWLKDDLRSLTQVIIAGQINTSP